MRCNICNKEINGSKIKIFAEKEPLNDAWLTYIHLNLCHGCFENMIDFLKKEGKRDE